MVGLALGFGVGNVCCCLARLDGVGQDKARFALWCDGMSFVLVRPVMVLRDKAKDGGGLKFSACLS